MNLTNEPCCRTHQETGRTTHASNPKLHKTALQAAPQLLPYHRAVSRLVTPLPGVGDSSPFPRTPLLPSPPPEAAGVGFRSGGGGVPGSPALQSDLMSAISVTLLSTARRAVSVTPDHRVKYIPYTPATGTVCTYYPAPG